MQIAALSPKALDESELSDEMKAHENDINNIRRLLNRNKLSHEEIAEDLNVPLELVKETALNKDQ